MSHNLDQCMAEINEVLTRHNREQIDAIKKAVLNALRKLIFIYTPHRSWLLASNNHLLINGISRRVARMTERRKARGVKFTDAARLRMDEASEQFANIKHVSQIRFITITNNTFYGAIIDAKHGMYDRARQFANMELTKAGQEIQ